MYICFLPCLTMSAETNKANKPVRRDLAFAPCVCCSKPSSSPQLPAVLLDKIAAYFFIYLFAWYQNHIRNLMSKIILLYYADLPVIPSISFNSETAFMLINKMMLAFQLVNSICLQVVCVRAETGSLAHNLTADASKLFVCLSCS